MENIASKVLSALVGNRDKPAADATSARRTESSVDYSRWFKKGIDAKDVSGTLACQRLRTTYLTPLIQPTFKIERSDKLFAMGSCFARGIEKTLLNAGFDVVSAAKEFDKFPLAVQDNTPLGFTNKYNTFSMLNELTWGLDPDARFPEKTLVDVEDGTCIDPHINPTLKLTDRSGTIERRKIITDVVRRIKDCRLLFLTLGLVEVWYDSEVNVHLNVTPFGNMRKQFPGRYRFFVTNYQENLGNLEKIYQLLKVRAHPDLRIIVTVSPVPLMATYSGQDVILANTYSKSTLRAVAQDWAAGHDNVQYFPSYEIVMHSDRQATWFEDDLRHVQGKAVNHIMDLFMKHYVG